MKASLSVSVIIAWAATFQRMNWPHLVTQLELGGGGGGHSKGATFVGPNSCSRSGFQRQTESRQAQLSFSRFPPLATLEQEWIWKKGGKEVVPGLGPGRK